MIISNLDHLEVVGEDNNIEGGFADAYANATANAYGDYFAATYTNTRASAESYYYYYYYGGAYASSGSTSSATAE
jgi:hypothetical protein